MSGNRVLWTHRGKRCSRSALQSDSRAVGRLRVRDRMGRHSFDLRAYRRVALEFERDSRLLEMESPEQTSTDGGAVQRIQVRRRRNSKLCPHFRVSGDGSGAHSFSCNGVNEN